MPLNQNLLNMTTCGGPCLSLHVLLTKRQVHQSLWALAGLAAHSPRALTLGWRLVFSLPCVHLSRKSQPSLQNLPKWSHPHPPVLTATTWDQAAAFLTHVNSHLGTVSCFSLGPSLTPEQRPFKGRPGPGVWLRVSTCSPCARLCVDPGPQEQTREQQRDSSLDSPGPLATGLAPWPVHLSSSSLAAPASGPQRG